MDSTRFGDNGVAIERLDVSAYTVPTDFPESDGTIKWDKTTLVLVEATAGGKRSGGFTSYSREQLQRQLGDWAADGIPRVKMKIGRHPEDDFSRVADAREAIGPDTELFVDANGAYSRKQAVAMAEGFAKLGVTWFEEPVSSDDLDGLNLMRDRAPAGMEIAAGEYGYYLWYFRRMLEADAVDVLQADATRCAGITGFMRTDALVEARSMELSAHCGPSIYPAPPDSSRYICSRTGAELWFRLPRRTDKTLPG